MQNEAPRSPSESTAPPTPSMGVPLGVVAFLTILLVGGGYYTVRNVPAPPFDSEEQQVSGDGRPIPFEKWEKPAVAFILSGQMHGYTEPCGCSHPQYGGLVRRYNFIESLKAKGWDVVGLDLGDLGTNQGIHAQNLLKFDVTVKALNAMNYRAFGIGKNELLAPLGEALTVSWEKKRVYPRPLSLTLDLDANDKLLHGLNARPYEIISLGKGAPTIGVLSMMGPDMRNTFNKEKYLANQDELPRALNAFAKEGAEIGIILHHEYPVIDDKIQGNDRMIAIEKKRREMAASCATFCADARKANPKIPPIHVMMVVTDFADPPSQMRQLDPKLPTQAVEIGHKGIYVGLVGMYRDAKEGFRTQYQLVKVGPEWETPEKDKAAHPVIAMFEKYNLELKQQKMLDKYPRSPHFNQLQPGNQKGLKATYVGSDRCMKCHEDAADAFAKTAHANATKTLELEKHPSNRQYDPQCMKCHTVGFNHPGGYNDIVDAANWPQKLDEKAKTPDPKALEVHNKKLRNVGCESCHGPGSEHVKKTDAADIHKLINPYRPSKEERALEEKLAKKKATDKDKGEHAKLFQERMMLLSRFCITCHDEENDVKWGTPGHDIVDKWISKGIIHRTKKPGDAPNPAPPAVQKEEPPIIIERIDDKKK